MQQRRPVNQINYLDEAIRALNSANNQTENAKASLLYQEAMVRAFIDIARTLRRIRGIINEYTSEEIPDGEKEE